MGTETVQGAEAESVVSEASIIDAILDAHGHVEPPPGSFTVRDYVARAAERGMIVKPSRALQVLRDLMDTGKLDGRKLYLDGRQRWVFWEKG